MMPAGHHDSNPCVLRLHDDACAREISKRIQVIATMKVTKHYIIGMLLQSVIRAPAP